jgi:hypothetical protein
MAGHGGLARPAQIWKEQMDLPSATLQAIEQLVESYRELY